MSNIKRIRRRIKAAKNISQITKAMEMVAASKMRKAQAKALASRPYADKLDTILARISGKIDPTYHPLLSTRPLEPSNTLLIVLMSPDKGLCGSLNSNLFRALDNFEKTLSEKYADVVINFQYVTLGKKAREHILKTGRVLHAEFTHLPDRPAYQDVLPITKVLLDGFLSHQFARVYFLYTNFVNTLSQKAISRKLLPIDTADLSADLGIDLVPAEAGDYLFEPDSHTILDWLLPYYFELEVYQKVLEAQASEHSARMVAMRNASDNAKEILSYLKLEFNRQRQSAITNEIANITTSRLAVGQ